MQKIVLRMSAVFAVCRHNLVSSRHRGTMSARRVNRHGLICTKTATSRILRLGKVNILNCLLYGTQPPLLKRVSVECLATYVLERATNFNFLTKTFLNLYLLRHP